MSVGDLVTAWQNPFFSTIFFYFIKLILVEDPALSKAPVVTGQTSSQQVSSVGGTSLHPAFLPLASYFLPCILAPCLILPPCLPPPCLILPPLHPASLLLTSYSLLTSYPSPLPHFLSLHPASEKRIVCLKKKLLRTYSPSSTYVKYNILIPLVWCQDNMLIPFVRCIIVLSGFSVKKLKEIKAFQLAVSTICLSC